MGAIVASVLLLLTALFVATYFYIDDKRNQKATNA